jgi:NAD(P) transhydrogenase subunit alpha
LIKAGMSIVVERGAGLDAGYPDDQYAARGATLASRAEVFEQAEIVVQVRALGANPQVGREDVPRLRRGQIVVGMGEPLSARDETVKLADTGVSFFALELVPRITRAQSMDVLSSLATVSGYEAVLMGAATLPKMFPMLMTAAGTITPSRVFVLGVGVAGLQAIATAKRLGAVVSAYDVRPSVKDQVISVGAKFVTLDVDASASEDKGGYAKAMDENFYRRQRELMTDVLREQDLVITTAAVPGKRAPILITREMVNAMAAGSVIVDMAAGRGGNCELTRAGETVVHNGVTILGPTNLPAHAPYHASQMFAGNVVSFLKHLNGFLPVTRDASDEIVRDSLVTHAGQVVNARVSEALGLGVESLSK